nr:hypothetical protein [Pseudorhodoferax sp. Leaf267]
MLQLGVRAREVLGLHERADQLLARPGFVWVQPRQAGEDGRGRAGVLARLRQRCEAAVGADQPRVERQRAAVGRLGRLPVAARVQRARQQPVGTRFAAMLGHELARQRRRLGQLAMLQAGLGQIQAGLHLLRAYAPQRAPGLQLVLGQLPCTRGLGREAQCVGLVRLRRQPLRRMRGQGRPLCLAPQRMAGIQPRQLRGGGRRAWRHLGQPGDGGAEVDVLPVAPPVVEQGEQPPVRVQQRTALRAGRDGAVNWINAPAASCRTPATTPSEMPTPRPRALETANTRCPACGNAACSVAACPSTCCACNSHKLRSRSRAPSSAVLCASPTRRRSVIDASMSSHTVTNRPGATCVALRSVMRSPPASKMPSAATDVAVLAWISRGDSAAEEQAMPSRARPMMARHFWRCTRFRMQVC